VSDERCRVLTLIDKPIAMGGAERLAVDLTVALDEARFVRYFCATRRSPFPQLDGELRAAGVHYLALDRSSRLDLLPWLRLERLLREERIDVVHAHLFGSNVWGSLIGRLARVPIVVAHEHTWSYVGRPLRKLADRQIIGRLADTIIAVSDADAAKMAEVERIPRQRIVVIRNGIRNPSVTSDRETVRAALGIAPDAPVVAAVSVIRPQKRLDRLIEAAAILRANLPAARVLIVGAGYAEETARLQALLQRRGLHDAVLMVGPREDAANVMAAADVGVITSDYEGIPLALLEFMALARPVVATAVGGIPEVVEDGVTGILVTERTPEGIAAALHRVLTAPAEEREAMGRAARVLQQETYSFDAYVRAVTALYDELLAHKRARAAAR
jgi:glycosyltransferase involved in cell wall biosynthesis